MSLSRALCALGAASPANVCGATANSGMTAFTIATVNDNGVAATAVNCYWTTANACVSVGSTATAVAASLFTKTVGFTQIQ
ncbi:hypothetical protein PR003_g5488 [Phytophthora rubi]|nr:hypothetical protein PR001_g1954 [Phytophthora rubi]KAE9350187.1 hypothetical protein PR003_g5488 [Phytophthora rubi]